MWLPEPQVWPSFTCLWTWKQNSCLFTYYNKACVSLCLCGSNNVQPKYEGSRPCWVMHIACTVLWLCDHSRGELLSSSENTLHQKLSTEKKHILDRVVVMSLRIAHALFGCIQQVSQCSRNRDTCFLLPANFQFKVILSPGWIWCSSMSTRSFDTDNLHTYTSLAWWK